MPPIWWCLRADLGDRQPARPAAQEEANRNLRALIRGLGGPSEVVVQYAGSVKDRQHRPADGPIRHRRGVVGAPRWSQPAFAASPLTRWP